MYATRRIIKRKVYFAGVDIRITGSGRGCPDRTEGAFFTSVPDRVTIIFGLLEEHLLRYNRYGQNFSDPFSLNIFLMEKIHLNGTRPASKINRSLTLSVTMKRCVVQEQSEHPNPLIACMAPHLSAMRANSHSGTKSGYDSYASL